MDDGRWTMADGRWPMADGRWTMDDEFRAESPVDFLAQAAGLGDGAYRNVIGLKARSIHAETHRGGNRCESAGPLALPTFDSRLCPRPAAWARQSAGPLALILPGHWP